MSNERKNAKNKRSFQSGLNHFKAREYYYYDVERNVAFFIFGCVIALSVQNVFFFCKNVRENKKNFFSVNGYFIIGECCWNKN